MELQPKGLISSSQYFHCIIINDYFSKQLLGDSRRNSVALSCMQIGMVEGMLTDLLGNILIYFSI